MDSSSVWKANSRGIKAFVFFLILAFALGSRLFFSLRPGDRVIWSDEQKNILLAQNMSQGAGYVLEDGRPTAIIPIGYPGWICLLYKTGLDSPTWIRVMQAFISLFTLLLCAAMSRWLLGPPAAWGTLLLGGLYPYFIYLPGTVLATTLYSLLLVAAVWLYLKAVSSYNKYVMFSGGLLWGLAILTVTTAVVLVAATLLWHLRHAPGGWQKKTATLAPLLLGIFLVITPWLIRNQVELGKMTLASNGGYNLWLGNHADSSIEDPCSVQTPETLHRDIVAAGDRWEIVADSLFSAQARAFILQHPGLFVQRTLLKAAYFWRPDPSPVTSSYVKMGGVIKLIGLLSFAPLLGLALWGYWQAPTEKRKQMTLWFYMAFLYTLIHAVMIVKVRFRLPIDHFLIMAAAYGGGQLWMEMRARSGRLPSRIKTLERATAMRKSVPE